MKLHPLTVLLRGGNRALGLGIAGFVVGSIGGSFLAVRGLGPTGGPALGLPLAIFFALVALAYEVAYFRRFEYELTASSLDIRSGVLSRRDREIPLGRIQNVDIRRTLVVRALGLAAINVETAGGGSTEARLQFVHFEEARRLQEAIQQRKRRLQATDEADAPTGEPTPWDLIFELDDSDLVLFSVLSFDPRVLSILFFVLPSAFPVAIQRFDSVSSVILLTLGMIGVLILATGIWVMSAFARFVQFYGFKLHRADDELRYERGLLQRYDGSIPLDKVQTVVIEENVLMRHFGYASMSIETAGYAPGSTPSGGSEAAIPLAKRAQLLELARTIEPFEFPEFERPPRRARQRYAVRYGLIVLAGTLLGFAIDAFVLSIPWYLTLLVMLPVPIAAHKKWEHRGWALEEGYALTRSGFWRRTTHVVPDFRIQTVIEYQTIFQRRWRLGTVVIDTASSRSLLSQDASALDVGADVSRRLRETLANRLQTAVGSRGASSAEGD